MSKDKEFHEKTDKMFSEKLNYQVRQTVRVKNTKENKVLSVDEINYSRLMFDSELNMYKLNEHGYWTLVASETFKPVIVEVMA